MAIGDDDVVMSSEYTNKWKGNWALRLIGGSFLAGLIFSFLALGSRSVVFLAPSIGVVLVSFGTAVGWFLATSVVLKITGGFVSTAHVLSFWLIGWAAGMISDDFKDQSTEAGKFYSRLHALTVLYYFIGLLVGFYVGGLIAGALISSFAIAATSMIPYSPGAWPGQGGIPDGSAFIVEIILSTIFTTIIAFLYLRNQEDRIPLGGAFTLLALTFVGFNLTGAPLDGTLWLAAELVKCTYGTGCFVTPSTTWWWAYSFGGTVGALLGTLLAYFANYFYPRVKEKLGVNASIDQDEGEPMVGASSAPTKQRRNVSELGDSLF